MKLPKALIYTLAEKTEEYILTNGMYYTYTSDIGEPIINACREKTRGFN